MAQSIYCCTQVFYSWKEYQDHLQSDKCFAYYCWSKGAKEWAKNIQREISKNNIFKSVRKVLDET